MQNDQDRRAFHAILLSLLVYMVWMSFYGPPIQDAVVEAPVTEVAMPGATTTVAAAPIAATPSAEIGPTLTEGAATVPAAPVIREHEEIFRTDDWTGSISSANGSLRGITLSKYTEAPVVTPLVSHLTDKFFGDGESSDEGWQPYVGGDDAQQIITDEGAMLLAGAGALDDDGAGLAGAPSAYTVERRNDHVIATRHRADGLTIQKTWRASPHAYAVEVDVTFINNGAIPISDLWVGVSDRLEGDGSRFVSAPVPQAFVEGDNEVVYDISKVTAAEPEVFTGSVSWFGIGDRYFMTVLAPKDLDAGQWTVSPLAGGRVSSAIHAPGTLAPGESKSLSFVAYAGPKHMPNLMAVGHDLPGAVEFGFFGLFAKVLLWFLQLFQAGVVNWGAAIILLTLFVKICFFPLTQKAFISSRKMQAVQPKMKAMQEKYKDNKEVLQQEMMKFYKSEGVNPLGGCLPTLIQMPVWFALYTVFLNSFDLYDSSFLYLKDLTAADPYAILPVLYMGLMFLNTKLMPMPDMSTMDEKAKEMAQMQRKMFKIMPLAFGIFMFNFPSGLVVYFCVNISLSILQLWMINRKFETAHAGA